MLRPFSVQWPRSWSQKLSETLPTPYFRLLSSTITSIVPADLSSYYSMSLTCSQALLRLPLRCYCASFFLDRPGRYLCFSTHWDLDLSEVLGQVGTVPSPRGRCVVTVARTTKLATLRLVANVNPVEVALYAGLPGLIYSIKTSPYYNPHQRLLERVKKESVVSNVANFVTQFCTGNSIPSFSSFSEFTYRDEQDKVVWPLCYVEPFLTLLDEPELANLIVNVTNACALPSTDTGLEWEYIARVAVAMVAFSTGFRELTSAESLVMGKMRHFRPRLVIENLPRNIETIEDALEYIDIEISKLPPSDTPILFLALPTFSNFPLFDGIIRFVAKTLRFWRGLQMKLSRGLPTVDCPENVHGVLLRGDPPSRASQPTTRAGWTYLSLAETMAFLPHSMHSLLPHEWKQEEEKASKKLKAK